MVICLSQYFYYQHLKKRGDNIIRAFPKVKSSIFFQQKTYFSQFIDKFLKFEEMGYLTYHVNLTCDRSCLSFLSIQLRHNISQLINQIKIEAIKSWYYQVFPNPSRDKKLEFLNVALAGLLNFSKFNFSQLGVRIANYFLGHHCSTAINLPAVFRTKHLHTNSLQYAIIFSQSLIRFSLTSLIGPDQVFPFGTKTQTVS